MIYISSSIKVDIVFHNNKGKRYFNKSHKSKRMAHNTQIGY